MKKYFIASVIALISIFSFNNEIRAEEKVTLNFDYSQYNNLYNNHSENMNIVLDYLKDYENEYYYFITFSYSGFEVYVCEKNINIDSYTIILSDHIYSISSNDVRIPFFDGDKFSSNFNENFTSLKYDLENDNLSVDSFGFASASSYSIDSNNNIISPFGTIMYYTNFDNYIYTSSEYDLNVNGSIITNGNIMPTYYDVMVDKSLIEMTKTFANDLDGNEIYIIRSDFTNVFDSDYTYQIKTDYTDWQDITSDIFEASNSGYYFYDYTLKYNSKLYARVLNMQGEVVEENEIEVTELKDYMNITYAPANDLNGNYVIAFTVDLRNCWDNSYTYQYSYDNETFYNMSVDENNQVFYLNHGIPTPVHFRVIDSSNNVICQRDYTETFEGLSFSPITEEFIEIVNGFRMIGYSIDISKFMAFSDIYNYRFVINGIEQDAREVFTWNIYEENFDTFEEIDFKLYVDNYLIFNIKYSPRYTQDNFDDKYTEIADNILNKDDSIYGFIDMFKNAFEDFYSSIISIGSDINDLWIGMPEVLRNFFIVIFVLILFGFIIRFIL